MGKQLFDRSERVKRSEMWRIDPDVCVVIGLDTKDGPEHPLYDARIELPVPEAFIKNVDAIGVQQAVQVIRGPAGEPVIVNGRQRIRACRIANKRRRKRGEEPWLVPCEPRSGSGAFLSMVAISTNEYVQQDSPVAKANKAARLVNEMGMSPAEVAVGFGVTSQTIRNWLRLLELDHKVQKAVERGIVKPTQAIQLHGLPAEEQREKLESLTSSGERVTVERARAAAKDPEGNGIRAPSKRVMRRVVEIAKSDGETLSDDFVRGVRWACGDLDAKAVKGLSAMLEQASSRSRQNA